MVAECVEVGSKTASDIVSALIIDDGNEERSNRKALFSKNLKYVGVSCAAHKGFGIVTVVDLIGGFHEGPKGATPGAPAVVEAPKAEPTPGN